MSDHSHTHQPNLESPTEIAQYDTSNMLGSLDELHLQVLDAWEKTKNIDFTPTAELKNITIVGMGGSGLGGHVIQTALKDRLTLPLTVINDYTVPGYVNEHSLVLLSSYSGNTEEVLAAAEDAQARGAQIMAIAAGGTLLKLAEEHNWAHYKIVPTHNPCNQPRMAIGYSVFGTIGLLQDTGLFELTDAEVAEVAATIEGTQARVQVPVPTDDNPAKALAYLQIDRFPVFIGAEFMAGGVHVATNQHNENAKIFASYHVIPEVNHHGLEALSYPPGIASSHVVILVQSELYHSRTQRRVELTQDVFESKDIETHQVVLRGPSKLAQTFEAITIFGYAGLYLAVLEGIDPAPIPNVENFKKALD